MANGYYSPNTNFSPKVKRGVPQNFYHIAKNKKKNMARARSTDSK